MLLPPVLQVSELSHKLGSAEGSARSLEQEVTQLRSQVKALAGDKHELELQLANTRAQLAAAQEKVGEAGRVDGGGSENNKRS
jgi:spindle assembly abnormal protein 6